MRRACSRAVNLRVAPVSRKSWAVGVGVDGDDEVGVEIEVGVEEEEEEEEEKVGEVASLRSRGVVGADRSLSSRDSKDSEGDNVRMSGGEVGGEMESGTGSVGSDRLDKEGGLTNGEKSLIDCERDGEVSGERMGEKEGEGMGEKEV